MIHYRPINFRTDWEWVSKTISPILCADTCGLVALRDDVIVAAAIFDSFTNTACNIHMGIDQPTILRYGFLPKVAEAVFIKLNRKSIFGLTPDNNGKALKFNEHIGMVRVAHIPDAYDDGVGYVVTRMDRASSPWLAENQEVAA